MNLTLVFVLTHVLLEKSNPQKPHFDPVVDSEELTEENLEASGLGTALATYQWVRCSYTHFASPSQYYLQSLSFLE